MANLDDLRRIAEVEFAAIVKDCISMDFKLRILLADNSFIDVFLSERLPDKFAFHWERMDKSGAIYRYDNVPDKEWKKLETFPFHFHKGSQGEAENPPFPQNPIAGFRSFMEFVHEKLRTSPTP